MTLEEKIKASYSTKAMEEARGEGNAIIKQHEDALRQLAKQHEEEVKRQVRDADQSRAGKCKAAAQYGNVKGAARIENERSAQNAI